MLVQLLESFVLRTTNHCILYKERRSGWIAFFCLVGLDEMFFFETTCFVALAVKFALSLRLNGGLTKEMGL